MTSKKPPAIPSLASRLAASLDTLVIEFVELTRAIGTEKVNLQHAHVVILAPDIRWCARTPDQELTHIGLVRRYSSLAELLVVLMQGAPKNLHSKLETADKHFRTWLELGSHWGLRMDPAANEKQIQTTADELRAVVAVLSAGSQAQHILIPDTNCLLASSDPTSYRAISPGKSFEFILLPTVLGELDKHKINHRNEAVREKAKKGINRIKGWRNQGSLHQGVLVDKSITVKAVHSEPNMSRSLPWLDADNADDRVIASVLSIQAQSPSAQVILVTGDINLQNKADAAMIQVADLDLDSEI